MTLFNSKSRLKLASQIANVEVNFNNITDYDHNGDTAEKRLREICYEGLIFWLIGFGITENSKLKIEELKEIINLLPKYDRLFNEIVRELLEKEYIQRNDTFLTLNTSKIREGNKNLFEESVTDFIQQYPNYAAHGHLIKACLTNITNVLSGKVLATEILFPNGNLDLVSGVYNGNPQADYFNDILAGIVFDAIKDQVSNLKDDEKLCLLEVGAGTGGTSSILFHKLQPFSDKIEYCFTDISMKFLLNAKDTFTEIAPYLQTTLFNVETSPYSQNVGIEKYDFVIATNVIHATKNISESLKNIKPILKKNGAIILNELAGNEIFNTLTFGLLDGWWLYDDEELRLEGSPGLSSEQWKVVLSEEGFKSTKTFPENNVLSQQLVVAYSDGYIESDQKNQKSDEKVEINVSEKNVSKPAQTSIKIDKLTNRIVSIAAEIIKLPIEEFNLEDQFTDYGFDSILATTLVKNINDELEIELKPTDIFNYPTILHLSEYISYEFKLSDEFFNVESVQIEEELIQDLAISDVDRGNRFIHQQQQEEVQTLLQSEKDEIAVVGMSGEFGSAENLDVFWEALKSGESLIQEVPEERWDVKEYFDEDKTASNKTYSKWGSFLKDIDKFDPLFFKISGKDAEMMDPQQRFFLKHCWKAIEDAAIDPKELKESKTGIFVGVGPGDYMPEIKDKAASAFWGNSSAILASRISYFLDLKGPAISIDTACSSSLVALNLACKSLQMGETDVALTGGVAIMCTSDFYILSSRAGMLSEDGQCYAFDDRANGFVPGEGVGVLILKRLSDAKRDGDHIYGVIKGSIVNQDGTTNGITAPSAVSQTKLETELYQQLNINPETISYVEAHGTGTSLGDPIEFQALNQSFRKFTDKSNFCAIGSVKTNIGHTLTAAGVAGMVKVLLALKHQLLPPSLNFERKNPLLEIEKSPFFIQNKLNEWKSKDNHPRRAVVSSFGFSGTNAHVLIEEYNVGNVPVHVETQKLNIIILSAKERSTLVQYAKDMLAFLNKNNSVYIGDLAYTLQIGRINFEERLAIVVKNVKELVESLMDFVGGKSSANIFTGNSKLEKLDFILEGEAGEAYLKKAIEIGELKSLAQIWTKGIDIDWKLLGNKNFARRIGLPTYPFLKEKYWSPSKRESSNIQRNLHPLVHSNISDFNFLQYASQFNGSESFFKDHIVNEKPIMPAAAFILLAKTAVELSGEKTMNVFEDLIWNTPFKYDEDNKELNIQLIQKEGKIVYEVSSKNHQKNHVGTIIHQSLDHQKSIDIDTILEKNHSSITSAELYELFKKHGLSYGNSFRGITKMFFSADETFSYINLEHVAQPNQMISILDNALQSCVGISLFEGSNVVRVPQKIGKISIYQDFPSEVCVHVRKVKAQLPNEDAIFDLSIIGTKGEIVCEIENAFFQEFKSEPFTKNVTNKVAAETFYTKVWIQKEVETNLGTINEQNVIFLAGGTVDLADKLKENLELEVVALKGGNEEEFFLSLVDNIKLILKSKNSYKLTTVYENKNYRNYTFVRGLLKSLSLENEKISFEMIGLDDISLKSIDQITNFILLESSSKDEEVRYIGGERHVNKLSTDFNIAQSNQFILKHNGKYLIAGGAGAIGIQVASYLEKTYDAKCILVGRKSIEEIGQEKFSGLKNAIYYTCDLTKEREVKELMLLIHSEIGTINGLIHCAGTIEDSLFANKTTDQIKRVLNTKIKIAQNLDDVTKNEDLDFFVLFSSLSAITGNLGQTDYAAGNAYLDDFSRYRNEQVRQKERFGKTISINWPIWEDGGMQVDENKLEFLKNNVGLLPMPSQNGIEIFEKALNSPIEQLVVFYGFETMQGKIIPAKISTPLKNENQFVPDNFSLLVKQFVKTIMSEELGLDKQKLEDNIDLDKYGIDSVIISAISNRLDGYFGKVSRTLFFEYKTINELTDFFLEKYSRELSEILLSDIEENTVKPVTDSVLEKSTFKIDRENSFTTLPENDSPNDDESIAIIGLSGRYPGANDLNEFWLNIKNGVDSITEIPSERWEISNFYDEEPGLAGKSYSKWGGFIDDVDKFDPLFFSISPREADLIDPQERLFLQTAWETIEDAGYTKKTLSNRKGKKTKVGVYVGVMYEEYALLGLEERLKGNFVNPTASPSSIANRVSYTFNFNGPSMAVDTMCSSSLTAINIACNDITTGNTDYAIAGGVNVSIHPSKYQLLSAGRFVSSKGKCESFGEGGIGYVPGEGVGAVLLKSYKKALEDGDHIYGVIKASTLNHGGKTNGYSVPNPILQGELIAETIKKAKIDPEKITYLEAHGTGTSLGDPIEIAGLIRGFSTNKKQYCSIGSIKSNIGHCESAAGISGLTKILLQLKHKQLVPSLHSYTLNSNIDFSDSPFVVQQTLEPWLSGGDGPLISGLSSFGAGGSNAHLIIEESPKCLVNNCLSSSFLIVLSAKNEKQLRAQVVRLKSFLLENPTVNLEELAYTLQIGRESMEERLAFIINDFNEIIQRCDEFLDKENVTAWKNKYVKHLKAQIEVDDQTIYESLRKNDWESLSNYWINGIEPDWFVCYENTKINRISLPVYPFAKDRYWIPGRKEFIREMNSPKKIHPLLHFEA